MTEEGVNVIENFEGVTIQTYPYVILGIGDTQFHQSWCVSGRWKMQLCC